MTFVLVVAAYVHTCPTSIHLHATCPGYNELGISLVNDVSHSNIQHLYPVLHVHGEQLGSYYT